jgi:putative ABC transport system substrate-binding protein
MRMRTLVLLPVLTVLTVGAGLPASSADQPPREDIPRTEARSGPGLVQQMFFLNKMRSDIERVGVIWKRGAKGQEQTIERANRAVASIKGKLYVGYVEDKSGVAEQFRVLTREHDVQAIWILENDGVVNASAPRKYLIKNTIRQGIPLLAPSRDWVDAGAPVAIDENNGAVQILLNEPAAKATALTVPKKYQSNTELIAAAN